MCKIVYNFVDKKILPVFINNRFSSCRSKTVGDRTPCHGSQKNKNKFIISREMAAFCLRIIDISCMLIDPDFVKFIFVNYENGKDFKDMNLNIETGT